MSALKPIGFIGLGIMGKGMIKNMITKLDSNMPFIVWNRSPDVCQEIISQFPGRVSVVPTAAEVIQQCDITYSMLSTMEASVAVFDAPDVGVLAGVSPGKIIVDCATLSPERMITQAEQVAAKGGRFFEAPVSGSKVPAETGQLIFLCGGDADVYELISPHLDAMGKAKFLFGPVGQGSRVKLVVNMIMGSMMTSLSEGMALAKSVDLPLDSILQVLDLGVMSNPMFRGKGPLMAKESYPTNFPLKHQQKDMRLALELAASQGLSLPTASAANDLFLKAMAEEHGDDDFSAVYSAVRK